MRFFVVLSTTSDLKSARKISHVLVQKKLAACVSIQPGLESYYFWKGRIRTSREAMLVIKTSSGRLKQLQNQLLQIHPYEVPEVLVLPVAAGSKKYLDWLSEYLHSK